MNLLVSKHSWLVAPVVFLLGALALALTWSLMDPPALRAAFDAGGKSFFETLTLSVYAFIVPTVWLCCPFGGSRLRKSLLCAAVSCVAMMAVVKELDLHLAFIKALYPLYIAHTHGTPFKMRFLTNPHVPFGAKAIVIAYFVLFFGVFAGLLAYFFRRFVKGFFRLHPVSWSVAFLGGSGVLVQVADRLPAWWRHCHNLTKDAIVQGPFGSFCTCFEEGMEMFIAIFALLAILQAHALYCPDKPYEDYRQI